MVEVKMNKTNQNKVLKTWQGTKRQEGVKSARKIAEMYSLPKRQVMTVLNQAGLTNYTNFS